MAMPKVFRKYTEVSLIKRILVGLVIGVILALLIPASSEGALAVAGSIIALCGTIFVNALKAVAPILVFFLVISALENAKAAKGMKTVILLYVISTLVAAIVAVIGSFLFPIDLTLIPSARGAVVAVGHRRGARDAHHEHRVQPGRRADRRQLHRNPCMGRAPWHRAAQGPRRSQAGVHVGVRRHHHHRALDRSTWPRSASWAWYTPPCRKPGFEIFTEYGQVILLLVVCMLVIALGTNPLMVFICTRRNPYPLVLRCLKDSGLTAFFTRSSAANIPVNMELCRKLGLDKDNYSVSIPLGATINMAGAAVTITVMTMCACHTLGIAVDPVTAVILSVLAAISACGASGVAGGSLLLIPLACSLFGISNDIAMQVVGIGFIIGVIQDSCETALNSSSDVLFTATSEYRGLIKAGKEVRLGHDAFSEDDLGDLEKYKAEDAEEAAEKAEESLEG